MTTEEEQQQQDAAYIAAAYKEALTEGRARMAILKLPMALEPLEEAYQPHRLPEPFLIPSAPPNVI